MARRSVLLLSSASRSPSSSGILLVLPHPFRFLNSPRTASSSSFSSSVRSRFLTPTALASTGFSRGASGSTTLVAVTVHSPAIAMSPRNAVGIDTPNPASCSICCFRCASAEDDEDKDPPGLGNEGGPENADADDPGAMPFSLSTSRLARSLSRSSCSCPRCRSRRNRLSAPWCLPVASWFCRSSFVSRTKMLQCLHQYFGVDFQYSDIFSREERGDKSEKRGRSEALARGDGGSHGSGGARGGSRGRAGRVDGRRGVGRNSRDLRGRLDRRNSGRSGDGSGSRRRDGSSRRGVGRLASTGLRSGAGDGRELAARSGVTLDLAIVDLADGNRNGGGDHLRLAILDDGHESSGDHGGSNDLATRGDRGVLTAGQDREVDGGALLGPVTVVQVVEVAREAAVEGGRSTKSERAVGADRKARGVDDTGLGGTIELELEVRDDGTSTVLRVGQDAVLEGEIKGAGTSASTSLLLNLLAEPLPLRIVLTYVKASLAKLDDGGPSLGAKTPPAEAEAWGMAMAMPPRAKVMNAEKRMLLVCWVNQD
ncbi:hypothetical protein CTA1_3440 [Colletotrichum tanaceti]|uniref:Uncharacterized protein n=1 Tax=Colletotrichum tanaceti TaxID=1306861 RepID=A0A4U6XGT2_9PEZI|nr:hypothetical protein CTA1_3440 [Colletotrichum tanaceti]